MNELSCSKVTLLMVQLHLQLLHQVHNLMVEVILVRIIHLHYEVNQ